MDIKMESIKITRRDWKKGSYIYRKLNMSSRFVKLLRGQLLPIAMKYSQQPEMDKDGKYKYNDEILDFLTNDF